MVLHNTHLFPQLLFLRSSDYTTLNNDTAKSDIFFELKDTIIIPNNIDAYLQLNSFKFINSFYNINWTNNTFYYTYNDNGDIANFSRVIPVGNYSITELINYLNNELTGQMILTYDSKLFKIHFRTYNYPSFYYSFSINDGVNSILNVLGFDEPTPMQSYITSYNLINLAGVQCLYITFENLNITSNTAKLANLNNVLECINIDVKTGATQSFNNHTNTKFKINVPNISFLNIRIYDEKNNLVNFNNTDWFMTLSFIFAYKMDYKPPKLLDLLNYNQPEQEQSLNINNNELAI